MPAWRRLNSRRFYAIFLATAALMLCALFLDVFKHPKSHGNPNPVDREGRTTSQRIQAIPKTEILAHAAGFTVIKNLYWYFGLFYFVTDQPWHIPPLNLIVADLTDGRRPGRIKFICLRPDDYSTHERTHVGYTDPISLEKAELWGSVTDIIDGPMILHNERDYIADYRLWIGEIFLGAWRVWSNYGWRTGTKLPSINRIAFMKQYSISSPDALMNGGRFNYFDYGPGAMNVQLMEKFFPGVKWDSVSDWNSRAEGDNSIYRFATVVLTDKVAGYTASSGGTPLDDVLHLPVAPDWLEPLRSHIFGGYHEPTSLQMPIKPLVVYLQQQQGSGGNIWLVEEDHERLLEELQKLEADDVADVLLTSFNSSVPLDEQVIRIAKTTILIGVNGNGLTHTLWMTPAAKSTVFELQPKICSFADYSPIAKAMGIQHYIVHESDICVSGNCTPVPACGSLLAQSGMAVHLEPAVVVDKIRMILAYN